MKRFAQLDSVALRVLIHFNFSQETTTMGLTNANELVPLQATADGVVRAGGTRVMLESVATAFVEGATAEEIVEQHPSLRLADAHGAISLVN